MPPWHPPGHSRRLKHLSLGMPKASPLFFIDNHQVVSVETTFLSLYILCAILGASFYLTFSLFLFVCCSCTLSDPSYLVWERETLRFFIRILLCFAYILSSILSFCFFLSALVLRLYLFKSCQLLLLDSLVIHLYLFRELFMVVCLICWNDKMACMWQWYDDKLAQSCRSSCLNNFELANCFEILSELMLKLDGYLS